MSIKQLSSFMAMTVNGGDRVSYTYDEIDGETGDLISTNNKESFYVLDEGLRGHIDAIRGWLRERRLAE